MKKDYISKSHEDTKRVAKDLVEKLCTIGGKTRGKAVVILLQGNLGSGKTTFVKAVAEIFGIKKNVTSPTFVLEKVYNIPRIKDRRHDFTSLVHIDAYRLIDSKDLNFLGWGELVDNYKNLIFVEWPEMVSGVFPENTPTVRFNFIDENTREITFHKKNY